MKMMMTHADYTRPASGSPISSFSNCIRSKSSFKSTTAVSAGSWVSHSTCKQPLWRGAVRAVKTDEAAGPSPILTGVIFEPFREVQSQLVQVPAAYSESLARQRYDTSCEAAINEQINVEYNVSYAYHALFSYFDRDNVGLPGFAKYFKASSEEEREHAEKLMKYQNKRGGRVKLQSILMPVMEFDHPEKGDALYSMELALALEKLTNEKLLSLHQVAVDNNDPQMCDFIESEFLAEQVEAIKKISVYVSQLRRVGKGHGVHHFDLQLQQETEATA
ncbi:hypothetical protein CY35_08G023400 [Sphagnum magellanicum]|nr:hypothetical protein CY35_08G023400 [Sphagnum magellanicum]